MTRTSSWRAGLAGLGSTRSGRVRLGLAVASGLLYAAALPPLGLWPLAWIALGPLCVACAGTGAGRGAALGGAFGMTAAVLTSPWLPAMVADYFKAGAVAAWPLALLAWVLGGAVYYAVFGGWLAWAVARGAVSPFVVGAVWWVLEWARAHAPVANPWALLGYTQMGWLPAAQVAEWQGPYGIGALLTATGAAAAGILEPRLLGRAGRRSAVAVGVVAGFVLAFGLARLAALADGPRPVATGSSPEAREGAPAARPLTVGLVQGAVPEDERYAREHLAGSLDGHLALTDRAAARGAELVLWPELAIDFYPEREPALRQRLVQRLAAADVDLLAGGLGIAADGAGERPTNSVFHLHARGILGRYDKVRLMPFSESRPLAFLPFDLLPIGSDRLLAGRAAEPIRRSGVAFGIAICSEAMHPAHAREVVRAGAAVLVAPTVDSWFGTAGGMRQQLQATAMRAIETRRYLLRPTAAGITAIVDPAGRVVAEAPVGEPSVLLGEVVPRRSTTPYVRAGDAGAALALLVVASDGWRRRRRHPARTEADPASGQAGQADQAEQTGQVDQAGQVDSA